MTNGNHHRARLRTWPIAGGLGVLVVVLWLAVLSTECGAAEYLPSASVKSLPAVLASVTVLSDAAMANETAAGLRSPAVIDATGHARVLLWDELKVPPQLAPANNATLTVTPGNPGK
jgi:hypothetical protein